jgi:hypothetical protein
VLINTFDQKRKKVSGFGQIFARIEMSFTAAIQSPLKGLPCSLRDKGTEKTTPKNDTGAALELDTGVADRLSMNVRDV